jgi:heptosyltransferase-1
VVPSLPSSRAEAASAVLVVRPSSLGDIVHALALVSDIRSHLPHMAIDWVAEEDFVPLIALDARIRRIIPVAFRRWRHWLFEQHTWREVSLFRNEIRRETYAAVLDLQEQVKGALIARIARGRRHGPDRASIREPIATLAHDAHHAIDPRQHLIDRCRQLAAAALGYRIEGPPRFELTPPTGTSTGCHPRPYVVLVHSTSRPDKLWPEAHWQELIRSLARDGRRVVLPWGSGAEKQRSERLAHAAGAAEVPARMSLPGMARMLADANMVIGVDTGLVHLAAALGTPTLSLFTATDPALAGVAKASPAARDLGGNGVIPSPRSVLDAAESLLSAQVR